MAEFYKAFHHTIAMEGGYVNDPADPGGETNFGISKRSYPDVDIAALTPKLAGEIYRRDFWDRLNLDGIDNQVIATELFDTAVNCGVGTAGKFLQEALNLLNGSIGPELIIDGIVGNKTISAANERRKSQSLLKTLNGLQFVRYYEIVKRNPSQKKWFRGWLRRVWEA